MNTRKAFALAATIVTLLSPLQAVAETQCRPHIAVGNVQFSQGGEPEALLDRLRQRRCLQLCGGFVVGALLARLPASRPKADRISEFTEPFIWRRGETAVRVEFWADEAVGRYWIADVAACPCRSK